MASPENPQETAVVSDAIPAQHSPLPWRVDTPNDPDGDRVYGIANRDWIVADIYQCDDTPLAEDVAEANAEFIVRACNSHADLLAALKIAVDVAESWIESELRGTSKYNAEMAKLEPCWTAIAKAEAS